MFLKTMTIAAPALALAITGGAADAATMYTDFSAWNAASTGVSTYVDFETGISNALVLNIVPGELTSTASGGGGTHRVNANGSGDGYFEVFWGTTRYTSITWDFTNPITSLFLDVAEFADGALLSYNDGSGDGPFDFSESAVGNAGIGFIFDNPITALTFSTTDGNDWATMDDLYFKTASAAVPVPAALPLLATAFGGLGFLGWRRRRSTVA